MQILDPHLPAPSHPMTPRALSNITDCIIHHEAGPKNQTVHEVDAEHRSQGWSMCGYNFIIDQEGNVYKCRPLDVVPSAAYGRNAESVNISLVGNFEKGDAGYNGPPTNAQLKALVELVIYLHQQLPTIVRTIGHRDVATLFYNGDGNYATACPGSELYIHLPSIRTAVSQAIHH